MIPDWKNLPGHLLDTVVGRLESPSDFLQFSVVCKSWYSIAKDNESKVSRLITPMLLICANKKDTWNVYNIKEKKLLNFQLNLPDKRYCGFSNGWIVTMEKNFGITLINPSQRVKGRRKKENSIVRLPPLPVRELNNPGYVFKCTLSADPVRNANNCVLVVAYGRSRVMSFIRVGKDATWTCIDKSWRDIVDLTYFEGRFYALTQEYQLLSFEITTKAIPDIQLFHHDIGIRPSSKYLVISNEKELLMIYRIEETEGTEGIGGQRTHGHVTTGFEIFEFNFDKCEWKRKDTLDDIALFLGDNSAISVPVSSSSWCEPNCIYFCNDVDLNNVFDDIVCTGCARRVDCGGYNLKTGCFFEPYTPEAKTLAENSAWLPIWVMPSFRL